MTSSMTLKGTILSGVLVLLAMMVASYLEKPDDAVKLNVQFADLPDGTTYQATTTLDAPAKNISVKIENSGHRPVSQ